MANFWILSNLYHCVIPFCRMSFRGQMLVWSVQCPLPFFRQQNLEWPLWSQPYFCARLEGLDGPVLKQVICSWPGYSCPSPVACWLGTLWLWPAYSYSHHWPPWWFMDGHIDPRWFIWNDLWNIRLEILATGCYHMGAWGWAGKEKHETTRGHPSHRPVSPAVVENQVWTFYPETRYVSSSCFCHKTNPN